MVLTVKILVFVLSAGTVFRSFHQNPAIGFLASIVAVLFAILSWQDVYAVLSKDEQLPNQSTTDNQNPSLQHPETTDWSDWEDLMRSIDAELGGEASNGGNELPLWVKEAQSDKGDDPAKRWWEAEPSE